SARMEAIRSPAPDGRHLRAGPPPKPRNRSLPRTAPRPEGPRNPRRPPRSRRTAAPRLRPWPPHDRHKPPIPPRPTTGAARFGKKSGILKTKRSRDLSRVTGRFFGRGVGVFVNLKHPVSRGERNEIGVSGGIRG